MKNILVISNKADTHADAVINQLNDLSAPVIRLNTEDFRRNRVNISILQDVYELITPENRIINFNSIKSVYIRRLSAPIDTSDVDIEFQKFACEEAEVVLESLQLILSSNIRWLNKPLERQKASNKIWQLFLAKSVGLDIPETLITNIPQEVKKFWGIVSETLYKPLKQPIIYKGESERSFVSPTIVSSNHINQFFDSFAVTPSQYQQYVDKLYELRIHIIDKEVISIKIDSQKYTASKIDWRELQKELDYTVVNIPFEIKSKLLNLMEKLRIKFGIIDMIVTSKKEFIFLEVNPDGNWLWIEDKIGVPITRSIANWLLAN